MSRRRDYTCIHLYLVCGSAVVAHQQLFLTTVGSAMLPNRTEDFETFGAADGSAKIQMSRANVAGPAGSRCRLTFPLRKTYSIRTQQWSGLLGKFRKQKIQSQRGIKDSATAELSYFNGCMGLSAHFTCICNMLVLSTIVANTAAVQSKLWPIIEWRRLH